MIENSKAYGHFTLSKTQVFMIQGKGCICQEGKTLSRFDLTLLTEDLIRMSMVEGGPWKEKCYFRNFCRGPHGATLRSSNDLGNCPKGLVL